MLYLELKVLRAYKVFRDSPAKQEQLDRRDQQDQRDHRGFKERLDHKDHRVSLVSTEPTPFSK